MEHVISELRGISNRLKQLQTRVERNGSERQKELMKTVYISLEDLREDLEVNRKTPNQLLLEEMTKAIEEVADTTGKSFNEVLEQAKEIYDSRIREVRDQDSRKRVINDLFKGW